MQREHIAQKKWAAAMFRTTAQNNIWSNFFVINTDSKITHPNKSYKRRDF